MQQHLIGLGCDLENPLLEEIVKRNHIINTLVKLNQSIYHNRIQSLIKLDSYLKELKNVRTKYQNEVPSFRVFLYNPRMASMPLIVVEAVRKLR